MPGIERFVRANATKRFAADSKRKALHDFIERRKRQIMILERRLAFARKSLKMATELNETESDLAEYSYCDDLVRKLKK